MSKLIKEEEQDNELNCSKGDKDLKSDNESILIDTPKINELNESIYQYAKKNMINIHQQIGLNMLN